MLLKKEAFKTITAPAIKRGKVYISGAISDLDYEEAKRRFQNAEYTLYLMGYAYADIINPMKLHHTSHDYLPVLFWSDYMRTDIKALCDCDVIYLLDNWHNSKKAKLEVKIAKELDLKMIFEL